MRKFLFLMLITAAFVACNNSEKTKSEDNEVVTEEVSDYRTYSGEFIYVADAAVLKGNKFIYGVTIDAMAEELAKKIESVKTDDFDMVPVVVKGVVNPKPEGQEGWDEIITIKEIVRISDKPSKADVKIEEKKS